MKRINFILFLFFSTLSYGQLDDFSAAAVYIDYCNPFQQLLDNFVEDSWKPSHGSAYIVDYGEPSAVFRSNGNFNSDGIYIDYPFESGTSYKITMYAYFLDGYPEIKAYMANDMNPAYNLTCNTEIEGQYSGRQDFGLFFLNSPDPNTERFDEVTITANGDYDHLWLFAETTQAGEFEITYVDVEPIGDTGGGNDCTIPVPTTQINGSSNQWQWVCYGEPFTFTAGISSANACDYDGYMLEVGEYVNGAYTSHFASHSFDFGQNIPTEMDMYEFVQLYSDWWDFEGGKTYRLKIATWMDINGYPAESTWRETAHYFKFRMPTSESEFVNVDSYESVYGYQGWQVDIAQICSEDVYIKADESTCYDRYRIDVQAFDVDNWEASGETFTTSWILDEAAPELFNLTDITGQLLYNQVYKVNVATGMPYVPSQALFFKRLPIDNPSVDGNFRRVYAEEVMNTPAHKDDFTLYTICFAQGKYIFDATATSCESKHRIQIDEFNLQTWQTQGQGYDSGWNTGNVPNNISISGLYIPGLAIGRTYRLRIEVGTPYDVEDYFFKIPDNPLDCYKPIKPDKKKLPSIDINVFPNPTISGLAVLEFPEEIDESFQLNIYRTDGQLISTSTQEYVKKLDVDLSGEAPGVYILQVQLANELKTIRLVRQ